MRALDVTKPAEKKPRAAVPAPPPPPPKIGSPLAELGAGAAWIVGLGAACQIAAILLHSNPLAVTMVQAVVVDLAAGKAGLRWDPAAEDNTSAERRNALRGIGIGGAASLTVIAIVVIAHVIMGRAQIAVHGPTTSLALGALKSIAIAVRDAQLYAGLPLFFVVRAKAPRWAAVVTAALLGGAALALLPAATIANVTLAAAVMAATAALWSRDDAGWGAAGLAGTFTFVAGTALRGGFADVTWTKGSLAPGVVADGAPAWIASALFAVIAFAAMRGARPSPLGLNSSVKQADQRQADPRSEIGTGADETPADAPEKKGTSADDS